MSQHLLRILKAQFQSINLDDRVDQVVAIIFRINFQKELELLFLQRNYSQTDHYSGDICLPGGYIQKGQSSYAAAIRETEQQTSLKLQPLNYIGSLNYTFFTRKGRSKIRGNGQVRDLQMGILMFQIQYSLGNTLKLQQQEIRAYKWVKLNTFLQGNVQLLKTWDIMYEVLPKMTRALKFPAFQIGMDRTLYGITMYIMVLFVVTTYQLTLKHPQFKITLDTQFYNKLVAHMTNLQIQGNQQQLKIAKKQYLDNRVGFLKSKL